MDSLKLKFVGDIMLGERFEKFSRGVKSKIERESLDPFEFCKDELLRSDINIGNLECVVSTKSKKKYPFSEFMKITENKLQYLINNNIRIVNLANNHIFDHGLEAFEETKQILKRNNIKYFGFGNGRLIQTEPIEIFIKEKKISFLGFDLSNTSQKEFEKKTLTILDILNKIDKSKDDILVLSLHWGYEYTDVPTSFMIRAAKQFTDKGVDIIYGHHPHILQGITKLNNKIFAPSLGNFIFDDEREQNRFTGILNVDIDKNNNLDYSFNPYFINERYQPVLNYAKKKDYQKLVSKLDSQIRTTKSESDQIDKRIISKSKLGHSSNKKRVRKEILTHFQNYLPFLYPIFKDKIIDKRLTKIFK